MIARCAFFRCAPSRRGRFDDLDPRYDRKGRTADDPQDHVGSLRAKQCRPSFPKRHQKFGATHNIIQHLTTPNGLSATDERSSVVADEVRRRLRRWRQREAVTRASVDVSAHEN
jgi:hypothetical protein